MSKKLQEQLEVLDNIGQESEKKGIKATQEFHKNEEIEQKKKYNDTLNKLDLSKGSEYRKRVLEEAKLQLKDQDIPKGCRFQFGLTKKGLVLYIWYKGKWYANGTLISQSPLFDAQAIVRLIDKGLLYGEILTKPKGIVLP